MDELSKQIDILIDKTEELKLKYMLHGLSGDIREAEGQLQAFKFIKLLINTNYKLNN